MKCFVEEKKLPQAVLAQEKLDHFRREKPNVKVTVVRISGEFILISCQLLPTNSVMQNKYKEGKAFHLLINILKKKINP